MEDESGWWFGAYLAIPASFAAFTFRILRGFLEQMAEAAGTSTTSSARSGSSFAIEQFPQELLIGTRVLTWLLLAYAVLGMAASLYLDSRWVSNHLQDWRPTPWLYAAVGLLPGVSSVVAIYYLTRRYTEVGVAGINAERAPSPTDARDSRWWVVLLVSAGLSQLAVTPILIVRLFQVVPGGFVFFITAFTAGTVAYTVFLVAGITSLVVDAKRIEASEAGWVPRTALYVASMVVLSFLALPIALVYLYQRGRKVGF